MKRTEYLPLGSILLLKGGTQKLMIVGRGLNIKKDDRIYFFDYAGVAYPEGLMGDEVAYFNHENISKLIFKGYSDIEDENVVDNINQYLFDNKNVVKGNVYDWRENES